MNAAEPTLLEQTLSDISTLMHRAEMAGDFKSHFTREEDEGLAAIFTSPDSGAKIALGSYSRVTITNPETLVLEDMSKILTQFAMDLYGVHLYKKQSDEITGVPIKLTPETNARLFNQSNEFMSQLREIANQRRDDSVEALRQKIRLVVRDSAFSSKDAY